MKCYFNKFVLIICILSITIFTQGCKGYVYEDEESSLSSNSNLNNNVISNDSQNAIGTLVEAYNELDKTKLFEIDYFDYGNGFPNYLYDYRDKYGKDAKIEYDVTEEEVFEKGTSVCDAFQRYLDENKDSNYHYQSYNDISVYVISTVEFYISGSKGNGTDSIYFATGCINGKWWCIENSDEKDDVYPPNYRDAGL